MKQDPKEDVLRHGSIVRVVSHLCFLLHPPLGTTVIKTEKTVNRNCKKETKDLIKFLRSVDFFNEKTMGACTSRQKKFSPGDTWTDAAA